MISIAKIKNDRESIRGSSNSLVSVVSCTFLAIWLFNDGLLSENEIIILSALRWIIIVPAIFVAINGLSNVNGGAISQAIFLFLIAVTIFLSSDIYWSVVSFARILAPFLISLGAYGLNNDKKLYLARSLIATLAFFAVTSFIGYFTHYEPFFQGGDIHVGDSRIRLEGLTFHPNALGYAVSVLICFGFVKVVFRKMHFFSRIGWLALMSICGFVLYKTDSKTAMAACAVGIAILMIKRFIIDSANNKTQGFILSIFITFLTLVVLCIPLFIVLDIISLDIGSSASQLSMLSRLNLWSIGWEDFAKNPVSGIGLGAKIASQTTATFVESDLPYFHSVLLNYMATCGIFGGLGVLIMIMGTEIKVLLFNNVGMALNTKQTNFEDIVQFCVVCLAVTLVFAVTEGALQGIYPTFLLFFLSTALLPGPAGDVSPA